MVNESRILQIDLKTAREWYRSDNAALKQLALKVFSEEELKLPVVKELVDEILSSPEIYKLTEVQKIQLKGVQSRKGGNISALKQLRILALYYNKGWAKGFTGLGYFISKDNCGWKIIKHDTNFAIKIFVLFFNILSLLLFTDQNFNIFIINLQKCLNCFLQF